LHLQEDVIRNIYDFRSWWRYLQFKGDAPPRIRFMLYERALKELPGSYKLWYVWMSAYKLESIQTRHLALAVTHKTHFENLLLMRPYL